jgi:S1-C subfamily serine protease
VEDGDLLLGDVIQSFGGRAVTSSSDLLTSLEERKAGETVSIRYLRDGRTGESQVTLLGNP